MVSYNPGTPKNIKKSSGFIYIYRMFHGFFQYKPPENHPAGLPPWLTTEGHRGQHLGSGPGSEVAGNARPGGPTTGCPKNGEAAASNRSNKNGTYNR